MPSPGTACSSPAPPTCRSRSPRTPSPARYGRCSTDERPPSPRPHHALMTQKVMSQRMILLVEDNPDDEALTRRALAKNNIQNEVRVARDGAEALELLFGTGGQGGHAIAPELVLLDLKLPKVDGLEVLRRIRADERTVSPGQPVTFEFRADRPGTFPFYCNLQIEDGCRQMRGQLVVRPRRY